jgi:HK97 family phage major capsid protein
MATPSVEELSRRRGKRDELADHAERFLLDIQEQRGADAQLTIGESERLKRMRLDLRSMDRTITEYEADLARVGSLPGNLARRVNGHRADAASMLSPLAFTDEALRDAYGRVRRGEAVALETRAPGFSSAVPLMPPQLFEIPTFPRHEGRLLDRLPGYALEAPSLEYVQVNAITGSAAIVGEGLPKPEIQMPATKLVCTALKLACHAGLSWENVTDYEAFAQAVRIELMRQVTDLENAQLWGGDPAAGGLNSLTKTAGILTLTATGTTENFTDLAAAIARLRTGPALAEPDLALMHPDTWATIRTQKDSYGRFLAAVDPTADQAESVWGVDVLQSTAFAAGEAVLVDTTLVGRVAVRESLTLRIGYSGDDFTNNIVRTVCEERLNFAVERPAAIVHVTALPAVAPTETTKTAAKK